MVFNKTLVFRPRGCVLLLIEILPQVKLQVDNHLMPKLQNSIELKVANPLESNLKLAPQTCDLRKMLVQYLSLSILMCFRLCFTTAN